MPDWFNTTMQRSAEHGRRWLARRMLTAEAIVYLSIARLALTLVPFGRLTWFFERPTRRTELTGDARSRARKEVRSVIFGLHQRRPGATTCFHRAIAAQAMLRRRGVSTTLYYGATTLPTRGLATHAWVQDGPEGVVGHITARNDQYHVLARYPKA